MKDPKQLMEQFACSLPDNIREWLEKEKHIRREIIERFKIGFNGKAICIPVQRKDGSYFFKFRANPFNPNQVTRYWTTQDASHDLYPRQILEDKPERIYIVEGELKALTLISMGYPAIAGTGGASTFKSEWVSEIKANVKEAVVFFDEDMAGQKGVEACLKMFGSM